MALMQKLYQQHCTFFLAFFWEYPTYHFSSREIGFTIRALKTVVPFNACWSSYVARAPLSMFPTRSIIYIFVRSVLAKLGAGEVKRGCFNRQICSSRKRREDDFRFLRQ